MRAWRGPLMAAVAIFGLAQGAAAFPDGRPVTIIVPWAAGGGVDTVTRIFAEGFEKELGTPINVVNRTGGGGLTGHTFQATATPDGYTLGVA
ncbi:tripartite tricarboxylate transporter substrate binding protein, partial [Klebsiella pneumoniae]|nr:tripartite tricarboxylate transporter substrate binding protein [Klebsiella pneumoniae]